MRLIHLLARCRQLIILYATAGGHTAEMLMLVEGMDKAFYTPRVYVAAETDKMSAKRAFSREQTWSGSQVIGYKQRWPGSTRRGGGIQLANCFGNKLSAALVCEEPKERWRILTACSIVVTSSCRSMLYQPL